MIKHLTFTILVLCGAAWVSAEERLKPDDAPVHRAEKPTAEGLELFSWYTKGDDTWRFALLPAPGIDKLKSAADVATPEQTLEGVPALMKKLSTLAVDEKIGWFNMLDKKAPVPDLIAFDFPPRETIKQVELYCTVLKIRLNIYKAGERK